MKLPKEDIGYTFIIYTKLKWGDLQKTIGFLKTVKGLWFEEIINIIFLSQANFTHPLHPPHHC